MSTAEERLREFVTEWDHDDNIGRMAVDGWDLSCSDISIVLDELAKVRTELEKVVEESQVTW